MSKLQRHIIYAGDVFLPVKSVDQYFIDNEKDIVEGYKEMCIDMGENMPLKPFLRDLYMDFYFENQHSLN